MDTIPIQTQRLVMYTVFLSLTFALFIVEIVAGVMQQINSDSCVSIIPGHKATTFYPVGISIGFGVGGILLVSLMIYHIFRKLYSQETNETRQTVLNILSVMYLLESVIFGWFTFGFIDSDTCMTFLIRIIYAHSLFSSIVLGILFLIIMGICFTKN